MLFFNEFIGSFLRHTNIHNYMPKKEPIYLKCPRKKLIVLPDKTEVKCNHVWKFTGKAVRRAVCPNCGTTVNITTNSISEKEYRSLKRLSK